MVMEPFLIGTQAPPTGQRGEGADRAWDLEVITMLEGHEHREGEALAAYHELAEQSEDESIQYLTRLIIADEQRHHQQITEMVNSMRSFIEEVDLQPTMPPHRTHSDPAVRSASGRLLALEKQDAKALRRLYKEMRRGSISPLLPLLVSLMIHDTNKHIEILTVIRDRLSR
jgi:hypothetical protein